MIAGRKIVERGVRSSSAKPKARVVRTETAAMRVNFIAGRRRCLFVWKMVDCGYIKVRRKRRAAVAVPVVVAREFVHPRDVKEMLISRDTPKLFIPSPPLR